MEDALTDEQWLRRTAVPYKKLLVTVFSPWNLKKRGSRGEGLHQHGSAAIAISKARQAWKEIQRQNIWRFYDMEKER